MKQVARDPRKQALRPEYNNFTCQRDGVKDFKRNEQKPAALSLSLCQRRTL